jgi:hypothetical protein
VRRTTAEPKTGTDHDCGVVEALPFFKTGWSGFIKIYFLLFHTLIRFKYDKQDRRRKIAHSKPASGRLMTRREAPWKTNSGFDVQHEFNEGQRR